MSTHPSLFQCVKGWVHHSSAGWMLAEGQPTHGAAPPRPGKNITDCNIKQLFRLHQRARDPM